MSTKTITAPSAIQSTLDALWEDKEHRNKIRASLFNLILFTRKGPREEYLQRVIHKLLDKFPSRLFLLHVDPDATQKLTVSVDVLSSEQGDCIITCDLIEIETSLQEQEKIPFLLLPHLIPDLPIFLMWAEDPLQKSVLFTSLQSLATRIIVDSETTSELHAFVSHVLAMHQEGSVEIADLNWARLESWRSLISSTFSSARLLSAIRGTTSLTITYNAQETPFFCHTKIQALYLQAWIAHALGWQIPSHHTASACDTFAYISEEKEVSIQLIPVRNPHLPPGMILALTFTTLDQEHFAFTRNEKQSEQIFFEHSTLTECSLRIQKEVGKAESGQSLIKEICHKGTSVHYIDMLQMLQEAQCLC